MKGIIDGIPVSKVPKGFSQDYSCQSNGWDRLGFPQPLHSGAASSQLFLSFSQSSFGLHKSCILFERYFVLSVAARPVLDINRRLCCAQGAQISMGRVALLEIIQQEHPCKDQWIDTTYALLADLYLC